MMHVLVLVLALLLAIASPAFAQYQGFLIPNAGDAAYPAQAQVFSQDFQAITEGIRSNGVLSGVAVTQQGSPTMSVHVAAGTIQFQGASIAVSAADLTVPQSDSINPRLDMVTISGSGLPTYTVGVVAQPPLSLVPPTIPQTGGINQIVVAFVYVPANTLNVFQNQIIDKRVFPGSGGGASTNGPFLLQQAAAGFPQARVLVPGTGLSSVDGGPGGSLTLNNTGVTQAIAGNCISVSSGTGPVTISDTCVSPGGTITGGGSLNAVAKFTAAQSIGSSTITDNGTTIGLGATNVKFTNQVAASGHACLQVDTTGIATQTGLPCNTGFSGSVTIAGSATTGTVTFGSAQPDTTYTVVLGTHPLTGTPPAVLAQYKSKTVNGFTVEITAAPGSGNSVAVDWALGSGSFTLGAGGGTVTSIATTAPITGGTITTTGTIGCATCVTGGSLTSGQLATGNTGQAITVGNLSGDVTTSGSTVTTLASRYKTWTCTVPFGDPGVASPVLADDNDAPWSCQNHTGSDVTITTVTCVANAGSPTVTPITTGGGATSILSGALTCGTATFAAGTLNGTPVLHSFSGTGATCSSTPCSADVNITSAGGTAKFLVVNITGTY